ncbi:hypothetical protein LMG26857_03634 [Achromobacter anxifer]|uniref:hypothetical protein n=1 Tax=Achromobacter anxifer TaxID=1287737 RepID=UPI00155D42AA|nr:hypothetical protein [Achromobacter anxifer]CAB5514575.1 hypothetical protein LMG26857_03634 [Achromobacter anxifer]
MSEQLATRAQRLIRAAHAVNQHRQGHDRGHYLAVVKSPTSPQSRLLALTVDHADQAFQVAKAAGQVPVDSRGQDIEPDSSGATEQGIELTWEMPGDVANRVFTALWQDIEAVHQAARTATPAAVAPLPQGEYPPLPRAAWAASRTPRVLDEDAYSFDQLHYYYDLGREQSAAAAGPAEAVQWRNIHKVVNALADFCFGSKDDPRWGVAHIAITQSLTANDGLDVLALGLERLPSTQAAPALDSPASELHQAASRALSDLERASGNIASAVALRAALKLPAAVAPRPLPDTQVKPRSSAELLDAVIQELRALSPEELRAEMRKHKNSDIANTLRALTDDAPARDASANPAAVSPLDDSELEDLAESACQEALSFGVSSDSFLRLAKTVRQRMLAAASQASAVAPEPQGEYPQLPSSVGLLCAGGKSVGVYTAEQMHAYFDMGRLPPAAVAEPGGCEIDWDVLPEDPSERAMFDRNLELLYGGDPRVVIATSLRLWAETHGNGSFGAMCAIFANEVAKLHIAAPAQEASATVAGPALADDVVKAEILEMVALNKQLIAQYKAPAWGSTRHSLAVMMMGFASNPGRGIDAAKIALDAATEPGAPLAYLRAAAPAQEAPAVPMSAAEACAALAINSALHRIRAGNAAGAIEPLEQARAMLAEAPRALAEVIEKAGRYDYIRTGKHYVVKIGNDTIHCGGHSVSEKYGPALDAAIDTAMGLQAKQPALPGAGPLEWTPGSNEFKDWCAQWFGPDSDDTYLAKAVHSLPPMAQRFERPAANAAAAATGSGPAETEGALFFSYNSEDGITTHDTAESAQAEALAEIGRYREEAADGWPHEVQDVCWGQILRRAVKKTVDHAPFMGGIKGSYMEQVDYVLEPVLPSPGTLEVLRAQLRLLHQEIERLREERATRMAQNDRMAARIAELEARAK